MSKSKSFWKELLIKFNHNISSDYKIINEDELLELDSKNFSQTENANSLKLNKFKSKSSITPKKMKPKPIKPIAPDSDECCGQGCQRCVFDIYYDRLEKYELDLEEYNKQNKTKL